MNDEHKKNLDELFAKDEKKDQEKYQKINELEIKYDRIIVPLFSQYVEYFRKQNLKVIPKNPTNLTIYRNNTEFYIICKKSVASITLAYSYNGAGLERNLQLSLEQMNEDTLNTFFQNFTEYVLKES